ncbi:hypothetical protein ACFLZ8_01320 [Planctomycetota bacterium]
MIAYDINPGLGNSADAYVTIALNWSTLAYPEAGINGPPPLPGLFETPHEYLEDIFIHRIVIFDGWVLETTNITGTIIIPDYNPEWVSIDVRAVMPGTSDLWIMESRQCSYNGFLQPLCVHAGRRGILGRAVS